MSTNNQSDWKEREVGALWKKVSSGNKANYCTGYIVSDELGSKVKQRVIMFANKSKSSEKSPDFIIYTSNEVSNEASPSFQKDAPKPASTEKQHMQEDSIPSL